jgi:hypothetical protein
MPPVQLFGTLIETATLDREFGAQLVSLGQNFLNRQRYLHFKPATRQPVGPPPEGRCESQRCEPCDKEPEREDHGLFDQALCSPGIFPRNYATTHGKIKLAAAAKLQHIWEYICFISKI